MIDAGFLPQNFFQRSTFNGSAAAFFFQQDDGVPATTPVWDWLHQGGLQFYLTKHCRSNRLDGEVSPHAYLDGEGIVVEHGAVVEAGAYVRAPCYIGADCQIRHGAYLRGNIVAGRGCVLGHGTEVKNSLLLDGAKAGHFAYIGDSLLGSHVNLGAGTKLANLKFNYKQRPIRLQIKTQDLRVVIAAPKLGAILADHVQTGCNVVLNPGTVVSESGAIISSNTKLKISPTHLR
ncbi:MAG: UDP-N-acetylglucosamine diphosphorylase [Pseudomonadota bacterium]|nr:UDP-N-acetylglucosamine diphosphorylase [Pseudomonadota bacterium]